MKENNRREWSSSDPRNWTHTHEDTGSEYDMPHHGHISEEAYGQRYPAGASSIEPELDRPVQTDVETHRNYLKKQQETFGDVLPNIHQNDSEQVVKMLGELLHVTKKLYRLQRAQVPIGKSYMYSFTQKANARVTHINFEDSSSQNRFYPSGVNFIIPETKLFSVQITNDGSGTVAIQINGEINDLESTAIIKSGETLTLEYTWAVIRTLNVVTTSSTDAALRVLIMY